MGFVRGVRLRWRALFRRAATEQELDDEIRHHLELEAEKTGSGDSRPTKHAGRRSCASAAWKR